MSLLPSVEESEKQLTTMAEQVITPELLYYMTMIGVFLFGLGTGQLFHSISFIPIFTIIIGIAFYGLSYYVKKNFEWK